MIRRDRDALSIVTGRKGGEAFRFGVGAEDAKLNAAIAHHIRIGGEPVLVAVEKIIHDQPTVVVHEIDDAKFNAELIRDRAGIGDILHPRAMADHVIFIDPIFHIRADHREALLLQEESGDAAVDAAGHGN